jgi:hypothetical protein
MNSHNASEARHKSSGKHKQFLSCNQHDEETVVYRFLSLLSIIWHCYGISMSEGYVRGNGDMLKTETSAGSAAAYTQRNCPAQTILQFHCWSCFHFDVPLLVFHPCSTDLAIQRSAQTISYDDRMVPRNVWMWFGTRFASSGSTTSQKGGRHPIRALDLNLSTSSRSSWVSGSSMSLFHLVLQRSTLIIILLLTSGAWFESPFIDYTPRTVFSLLEALTVIEALRFRAP